MEKLSIDLVRHVANLAQLQLSSPELTRFQQQLSSILTFVVKLDQANTKAVEPTSQVTNLQNVFREDTAGFPLSQEDALANASSKEQGYFKVGKVLEEQDGAN